MIYKALMYACGVVAPLCFSMSRKYGSIRMPWMGLDLEVELARKELSSAQSIVAIGLSLVRPFKGTYLQIEQPNRALS